MGQRSEIDSLIVTTSKVVDLLEPEALAMVRGFIVKSQLPNGAFPDRGETPDWYYSFFAYLLCRSLKMDAELKKLRAYVMGQKPPSPNNLIDWAVYVLLRSSFSESFWYKTCVSFRLAIKWVFQKRNVDKVYLVFLSLLILNHFWGWARCIARQVDYLTSRFVVGSQSPTSHLSALVLIRAKAGLKVDDMQKQLLFNARADGGFSAFGDHGSPDMLSTAVAGYALSQAGADIRLQAPETLNFISEHFADGAFLAGDGDPVRDLEYTFYGLLALSSFAGQLNDVKHVSYE